MGSIAIMYIGTMIAWQKSLVSKTPWWVSMRPLCYSMFMVRRLSCCLLICNYCGTICCHSCSHIILGYCACHCAVNTACCCHRHHSCVVVSCRCCSAVIIHCCYYSYGCYYHQWAIVSLFALLLGQVNQYTWQHLVLFFENTSTIFAPSYIHVSNY